MDEKQKKHRVFKEKGKIGQVTHWDLDYLSREEINDLYVQKREKNHRESHPEHRSGGKKLALMLIGMGLALLAGALFLASRL
ncbi:hypothetical protein DSCW_44640 [Desulfosarcina widdelii]|uniref:Uncharacterized protein n=1 Tax=Desulfosarcina widdelii TaxID=947919 RepID=A0A5K7ZLX3_9BACT|nr:hypothetical protein [Desulfosarcina widdelii]BBO77047.1 hypothetical protein DSCW_44640 [Desulfosarcina widdelii]